MGGFLTLVEPIVIINTVGSSFYDTAFTLSVYKRALELSEGNSDQAQALTSRLLLLSNCLNSLLSFISTILLVWLADRRGARLLLVVPQIGSVLRKSLLIAIILFQLPLEVVYAGAAVHGLCGGTSAYWGGLVTLAALTSDEERRSVKLNALDFCYGMAGVVGSFVSGFLYQIGQSGVPLMVMSVLFCVGGLLYSSFLLSYPRPSSRQDVGQSELSPEPVWTDWKGVALLITAIALFYLGMCGAEEVLSVYVLKPPLSWDSVWVGYGSATTSAMYLTSFLALLVLSRPLGDRLLILLGILSNCTGMALMAFATQSWIYFFARGIMMFACIPMSTIRAQISKILDAQLYGRVFGWLQSVLSVTAVLSELLFTSIYPLTLGWYSGFSFLISCAISYLSVLPILYLNWRGTRQGYIPISGNDQTQHGDSEICSINDLNTE